MNLNAQDYLDLVESGKRICFFDIESTGFKGDYNSTLVVSVKPFDGKPKSFVVNQVGSDIGIVLAAKKELESYHCWVSYYGKGFDIPFLNTRLLRYGKMPIEQRHHLDLYFSLKYNLATSRKGLGHMARWLLDNNDQKMDVGPQIWAEIAHKPGNLKLMRTRCESDCAVLEQLYNKTRHLVKEIKRGGI
jgi:hypothetical protein